jgi:hypothetical protein
VEGAVVQQRVAGRFGMLVGGHVDPTFGPVVTVDGVVEIVEGRPAS